MEAAMKSNQTLVLMYGRDETLLATRQWVLQSRGYRVRTIGKLADIAMTPQIPMPRLLLLCHTLSPGEITSAIAAATSRWPAIQKLQLIEDLGRAPSGILGQLLHTMDGPGKLITMVGELVGNGVQGGGHTHQ
jgi:hypothetical protein